MKNAVNRTDVVREYLKAFRVAGIEAGLYFSVLDLTEGINKNSCTPAQKELVKGQLVKSLQPDCLLMNIGWTKGIGGSDIVFFENGAGQEVTPGFHGPGVLCQKLTGAWYWRASHPKTPPDSAVWARGLMDRLFPMNVNLTINLSPNTQGRIDKNLADEFARIGQDLTLPEPLQELPSGWLRR